MLTVDIPQKSTHDKFYTVKNNASHAAQQQHVAEQKRIMKTNHFDFGPSDGTKMHTKPLDSVQPPGQQNDSFKVTEARQRLSQASWTTGQSPMKYETMQQLSFNRPQTTTDHISETKRAYNQLKSRISASSVMKTQDAQLYTSQQHTVHQPFGVVTKNDTNLINEQKLRLSKSNFQMGKSPQTYDTTQKDSHQVKNVKYYDKEFRLARATQNQKTNFVHQSDGFEKATKNGDFGPMTHKGTLDQAQANQMMNELKGHHFILGKDRNRFNGNQNRMAQTAPLGKQRWATMKSNF